MADMIDLDSFRELSYFFNFKTRTWNVVELMGSFFFGPILINLVQIEPSNFNANWPGLKVISDVNFTVNSPYVPCILSCVKLQVS